MVVVTLVVVEGHWGEEGRQCSHRHPRDDEVRYHSPDTNSHIHNWMGFSSVDFVPDHVVQPTFETLYSLPQKYNLCVVVVVELCGVECYLYILYTINRVSVLSVCWGFLWDVLPQTYNNRNV